MQRQVPFTHFGWRFKVGVHISSSNFQLAYTTLLLRAQKANGVLLYRVSNYSISGDTLGKILKYTHPKETTTDRNIFVASLCQVSHGPGQWLRPEGGKLESKLQVDDVDELLKFQDFVLRFWYVFVCLLGLLSWISTFPSSYSNLVSTIFRSPSLCVTCASCAPPFTAMSMTFGHKNIIQFHWRNRRIEEGKVVGKMSCWENITSYVYC